MDTTHTTPFCESDPQRRRQKAWDDLRGMVRYAREQLNAAIIASATARAWREGHGRHDELEEKHYDEADERTRELITAIENVEVDVRIIDGCESEIAAEGPAR